MTRRPPADIVCVRGVCPLVCALVAEFGERQRKKTLHAQRELWEEKRAAAHAAKEVQRARAAVARSEQSGKEERRRTELARVRRESQVPFRPVPLPRAAQHRAADASPLSEGAIARYFFAEQKAEAAADVRSEAVRLAERRAREMKHALRLARQARAAVLADRKSAAQQRQAAAEMRAQDAALMRTSSQRLESKRRATVLASALGVRAAAQETYDRRFVDDDVAALVAATEYGSPELILSSVAWGKGSDVSMDEALLVA